VLLVSLLGSAAGYLMFGFAGTFPVLFASRVIDGLSGGNISTAQAVIADITGPENRTRGMGIIGAAFGLGFILGPAIGGLLVGIRPWLPGVAAATMSLVAFVLVLTVLPETLDPATRRRARSHPLGPSSLMHALSHPFLPFSLVLVFLIIFAFANFETTFAQLLQLRFDLTPRSISYLFVYAGVLGAVVQGGLVGRLARRLGEGRLVAAGTLLGGLALGFLPYAGGLPATMGWLALLALGQGLASPALSSLTSKLVDHDEVGGVMGIYQAVSSLGRIVGPFWGELVYGVWGEHWPYRTASVVMLVACGVAVLMLARMRRPAGAV
jgi:DHA1 family tetracycline resistance protein-like MFS transporter